VKPDTVGVGPGTYPRPVVPRFSLNERDRRWAKVRALMRRENLDAIITLTNSSSWDAGNAYGRYLTSIGGNSAQISVVFPLEGPVTAITGPVPTPAFWLQFQDWVDDVRTGFFHATPTIIERLRELGLEGGRIGIAGLQGVARVPDGLISHIAYVALAEQLPQATLLNATFLMDEVRFVKSEEEIAMFKQAIRLVEGALDVLEREAGPGVCECVVYGRMMGWLLEQGSEPSTLLLWAAGNPLPPAVATMASRRPLAADDVIVVELDAKWCGYLGHGAMTAWVGEADATARTMAELQFEATQRCLEAMRPGTPMEALVKVCADVAEGTAFQCKPIIHGRGLGNDPPVLVFHARDERTARWLLQENSVFIVKPVVSTADGTRKVMWGDTVVVTSTGARRLGTRPAPLVRNTRS
jgi:Xaa-Pro aminopeptidase